jgi:hypothetical protein
VASETAVTEQLRFSEVHLQGQDYPPVVFFRIAIREKTGRFEKS